MSTTASANLSELTKDELNYVNGIQKMQTDFHSWLKRKNRLSEREKECMEHCDINHAIDYWARFSINSKEEFDVQHETGWRYWARSAQTIAAAAGQFLNDFRPLVEFASTANPFGGLAIGAISGLFAIAQSKSDTDDAVAIAMADVMDRLPGFRMLQNIYRDENPHHGRLRRKIIVAYGGVIELAMASTKYYLKPGITRWWKATWNPEEFTLLAARVQGYVIAVVMQREELLTWVANEIKANGLELTNKVDMLKGVNETQTRKITTLQKHNEVQTLKIGNLEAQNIEQTRKIDRLRKLSENQTMKIDRLQKDNEGQTRLIEELQKDNKCFQLDRLEARFNNPGWSLQEQQQQLKVYEQTLTRARNQTRPFEWMDAANISHYNIHQDLQEWKTSAKCSMLLIIGVNHVGRARSEHCWVSPLALDLTAGARASQTALAYYIFDFNTKTSMHTAMRVLLLQLLRLPRRLQLDILSPQMEKYQRAFQHPRQPGADDLARKTLEDVAITIVQLIEPEQEVWIIVDRLDRCAEREQRHLLSLLVRLVEGAHCCLRVFAVASKSFWNVEDYQIQELEESSRFKVVTERQRQPDEE